VADGLAVVTVTIKITDSPVVDGFRFDVTDVALAAVPTTELFQFVSKLATLIEPSPVASSYPASTRNPLRPPVRLEGPGVLLLHMLGVVTAQLETPLMATVMSLKTSNEAVAASS
jgi:hypothetical protein